MNRETKEILNDSEAMQAINEGLNDLNNGDIQPLERETMNYEQMKTKALEHALDNYIVNNAELIDEGRTPQEILAMLEAGSAEVVVWEPFEYWEVSSVEQEVTNLYLSNVRNYEDLLKSVMGDDAFITWKEGK